MNVFDPITRVLVVVIATLVLLAVGAQLAHVEDAGHCIQTTQEVPQ